jgi:Domain of unknown function (DUF1905)
VADPHFAFTAPLWQWDGQAAWHFVSLPAEVTDEIADLVEGQPRAGFGSVAVDVTIGASNWQTSVFPDSKRGTYLLPVKRAVRIAEGLGVDEPVTVSLRLRGLEPGGTP